MVLACTNGCAMYKPTFCASAHIWLCSECKHYSYIYFPPIPSVAGNYTTLPVNIQNAQRDG